MNYLQSGQPSEQELRSVMSGLHINNDYSSIDAANDRHPIIRPRRLSSVTNSNSTNSVSNRRTLVTFTGVFCPVALSQFSTLLFLRLGFVVGQSGILETTAQMLLAYLMLYLTVLSICAISTNGAVEGGGVYYMLSRTLGPEFGGSIGILFYFANVFACALYIAGFVEGLVDNFGDKGRIVDNLLPGSSYGWYYLYCTIVLFFCLFVCLVGGSMFAKTSLWFLAVAVICFFSVFISCLFQSSKPVAIPRSNHLIYRNDSSNETMYFNFTGMSSKTFRSNLFSQYGKDYTQGDGGSNMNFVIIFGVLFSSVTGIMNGANLSGELKKPSKSIPLGTLTAVTFTMIVYLTMSYLVAASCDRNLLLNNNNFMQPINFWPPFVAIGVFATTLSAALGNLMGGSRILEALAIDNVFGIFLKPATMKTNRGNPIGAVVITYVLVQGVMLINNLNKIASLVSVFFLLAYASTNLACAALDMASPSNFRPTFKVFHWQSATLGLLGCLLMCFLIDVIYAAIATIMLLVLIIALHYRDLPESWGSISQALIFHQVRKYLLKLDVRKSHVKYWRPQILLMVANPYGNASLIEFVNDLKKGGLYVLGHVFRANYDALEVDPVEAGSTGWLAFIDYLRIKAFVELTVASSVREGLRHLVWLSGIGGMKPNLVCLGFYDSATPSNTLVKLRLRRGHLFGGGSSGSRPLSSLQEEGSLPSLRLDDSSRGISKSEFVCMLLDTVKMRKDVLVCRHFAQFEGPRMRKEKCFIDVWPVNVFQPTLAAYFDATCLLMLQLACILQRVPAWKWRSTLRVFLCTDKTCDMSDMQKKLEVLLSQLRIQAVTHVLSWDHVLEHITHEQPSSSHIDGSSTPLSMSIFGNHPVSYLEAMNQLIRVQSPATAVTFLYMPRPPSDESLHEGYLMELDHLTADLPPTVLVYGQHHVTTDHL